MTTPQHHAAQAQVAKLLPSGWDLERDILLIVGEDAGQIAGAFLAYGLKRVWVMLPAPLQPESVPEGTVFLRSRGELHRAVQMLKGEAAGTLALLRTPRCSLDPSVTQSIRTLAMSLLKRKPANEHIHTDLAPRWALNGFKNLTRVGERPLVSDLKDDFTDVPMIIVGAGPSLAKNIEHLRSAQDKAIIVCVARALHSLQSAGIVPDFAISLDAIDVRSHFRDIRISEIPGLLLSMTSHPNLFELKHPGIITFSANTEAEGWMVDAEDELVETPTGGSVSCAAMSIGLLWRCDPIIMVGQDLAFEDGAVYHHGGTDGATRVRHDPTTNTWTYTGFSRDLAHSLKDQMVGGVLKAHATAVPGYFGGSVPTTPEFAAVRQWFGFTAQDEAGRTTLYNCTEGGAYVDGMRHVPLSDVLRTLPPRQTPTRRVVETRSHSALVSSRTTRLSSRAQRSRTAIAEATRLAKACVVQIDAVPRRPGAMAQLQALEQQLSPALKDAFVLSVAAQADIRAAMEAGAKAKDLAASLAASRRLYTVIAEWGERLLTQ